MSDRFQNYRDRIAASVAQGIILPPAPPPFIGPTKPRDHWPVDKRDLVQRHAEIGQMALDWAVQNFRDAETVAAFRDAAP